MSAHFTTPTDEMLLLAETLGEVKTKTEKLEAEFSTQARPLEAATNALAAAISGIKALQFHILDNNLGALSARVEEMRKAVDEQVGVIALELKKADETNAAKAGQDAEALRSEIAALQAQLGTLGAQFAAQLERVEFSAKEEAKKLQLIPGPAGAAGASLNPRGTFIDGETYNRLDVVSWLGSSYIAAVDGVTEKPSRNSNQWQVLASRGGGAAGGAADFGSLAGVAQINQGGTGQTTRAAGLNALLPDQAGATQYMLLTDGAGNVSWGAQPVAGLPSQTGNSGKFLTTNGTSASWSNTTTNTIGVGALTLGSSADALITRAGAGIVDVRSASSPGTTARIDLTGTSAAGVGFRQSGARDWFITAESSELRVSCLTANSIFAFNSGTPVAMRDTTASTTTSSGALVVSGGVGVGNEVSVYGRIRAQLGLHADGNVPTGLAAAYQTDVQSGSTRDILSFGNSSRAGLIRGYQDGGGFVQWSFGRYVASSFEEQMRLSGTSATSSSLTIYGTTASNSTSSGALVVSGGVGVAGNITVGGQVDINAGTASAPSLKLNGTNNGIYYTGSNIVRIAANGGEAATFGATAATVAGTLTVASNFSIASTGFYAGGGTPGAGRFLYSATAGTMLCGQTGSSYDLSLANSTGTTILGVPTGTANVSIPSTSISTSTSSGALVVSGGVGVAGAGFFGGNIQCNAVFASNNTTLYLRPQGATVSSGEAQLTTAGNLTLAGTLTAGGTITSTNGSGSGLLGMRSSSGNASYVFWSETGVADRGILGFNNGSSTLSYRSFSSSFSTGTEVFSVTSGGNVTAGGSVQTAAPSGGTAAAWKLGTVASVSPTSPNRTIEVDIGGTIYYIHAKTTNN